MINKTRKRLGIALGLAGLVAGCGKTETSTKTETGTSDITSKVPGFKGESQPKVTILYLKDTGDENKDGREDKRLFYQVGNNVREEVLYAGDGVFESMGESLDESIHNIQEEMRKAKEAAAKVQINWRERQEGKGIEEGGVEEQAYSETRSLMGNAGDSTRFYARPLNRDIKGMVKPWGVWQRTNGNKAPTPLTEEDVDGIRIHVTPEGRAYLQIRALIRKKFPNVPQSKGSEYDQDKRPK